MKFRNIKKYLAILMAVVIVASLGMTTSALAYVNGPMFTYENGGEKHYEVVAYASSDENPIAAYASIGYDMGTFVQTDWGYQSSSNPTTVMAVASSGFVAPYYNYVSSSGSWASDGT